MMVGVLDGAGDLVAAGVRVMVGAGEEVTVASGAGVLVGVKIKPVVAEASPVEVAAGIREPRLANKQAVRLINNTTRANIRIRFNLFSKYETISAQHIIQNS